VTVRRSLWRLTALAVIVAMPLVGTAATASAKAAKAAPNCTKHPHKAACRTTGTGGASGAGTGPQITLQIDPEPVVETGQSEIHAVLQVETLPSFAGDTVLIESSQLTASCLSVSYENLQVPGGLPQTIPPTINVQSNQIGAVLDDDGNATVVVDALNCAPGPSLIVADLEVAPYLTATSTLVADPPVVTAEGLTVNPRLGGLNQVLETGDSATSGNSDVYAVFYVETDPVYAEQPVEIGSSQLEGRCGQGWVWEAGNASAGAAPTVAAGNGVNAGTEVTTLLDDDGNAVFVFKGASCAAGPSQVIADVEAGTHPTYVAEFTVVAPEPVI
jgi:hypothetical protein